MHRVLVLGAGFGGIAAAIRLRELLEPADEVVLVDRDESFAMGLRKNWGLVGLEPHHVGGRPIARLADRGITVVRGSVTSIDPGSRAAGVDGERIEADALVVALGAERDPGRVPGLQDHAIDAYAPESADAHAGALDAFPGGRVVIGIFGAPYPCPPGPFELAMLAAEKLERRGVSYGMLVFSPLPRSLPILGEAGCAAFDSHLSGAGISFRPGTVASEVRAGEVVLASDGRSPAARRDPSAPRAAGGEAAPAEETASETSDRIPFDLLFAVPPHRAPAVVSEAGLTGPSGWVPVDARTLETRFAGVHAIGDVTAIPLASGTALPKAGVFAQAEGEVVAARIADRLAGREPTTTFAGDGMCFVETGGGKAAMVRGGFLEDPPRVELTEAAEAHLAAKRAFETERLTAWFG
jgi:sulfide:quinone oxidoreductase